MIKLNSKSTKKSEAGFTLIETFVAILILVFAVIGPLGLLARAINDGNYAKNQITAHFLAQEAAEYIIYQRNRNLIDERDWLYGLDSCVNDTCQVDINNASPVEPCNIETVNGCLLEIDTDSVTEVKSYTHTGTEPSIFRRQVQIIPDGDNKQATVNVTVKWRNKNTDSSFTLPIVLMNQSYVEITSNPTP